MDNPAIIAEGLSKRYRIGSLQPSYQAVVDSIAARFRRASKGHPHRDGQPPPEETIWALKEVSFQVNRGEIVGVIGRNGAGKTTLLKILSRITDPTEGRATITGRVGSLLEVGTGFHPELTGLENIYLNGAVLGMKKAEIDRKLDEIVEFAEIGQFIDTPVKRYSSGMSMRLAFAVSAHLEPDILLIDEVLAVGDISFQKKCLGKMDDVAREGRTVLFVSHNLAAVDSLCQRGIVIEQGRVVVDASASEAIARYAYIMEDAHIPELAADSNPSQITISNLRVVGLADRTVAPASELRVRFSMGVSRPIDHLGIILMARNDENALVVVERAEFTGNSKVDGPGFYDVSVLFPPLWLRPGIYRWYIKARGCGSFGEFGYASDPVPCRIIDPETTGYLRSGFLAPQATWEVRPVTATLQ